MQIHFYIDGGYYGLMRDWQNAGNAHHTVPLLSYRLASITAALLMQPLAQSPFPRASLLPWVSLSLPMMTCCVFLQCPSFKSLLRGVGPQTSLCGQGQLEILLPPSEKNQRTQPQDTFCNPVTIQ